MALIVSYLAVRGLIAPRTVMALISEVNAATIRADLILELIADGLHTCSLLARLARLLVGRTHNRSVITFR